MLTQSEIDNSPASCPACNGSAYELGMLGARLHFRCRHCGCEFSHSIDFPLVDAEVEA